MQYKFDKPVLGTTGTEKYRCTMEWMSGEFIADESVREGGMDAGPDPCTLLLSSLASSALIAMRMYMEQKGWSIPRITVHANMYQETKMEKTVTIVDCDLIFPAGIPEEQKERLQEIASQCPIAKILENEIKVRTFVLKDNENAKKINYANEEITVVWKPELCQHSCRCWTQLPEVFDYTKKRWVNPNGASSEEIMAQVKKCPSGALTFFYNDKKNSPA